MSEAKDLVKFRSEMVVLLREALEVVLGYLPDLHCPPLDARGAPASCIKLPYQNYPFCKLQLVCDSFEHPTLWTNQSKFDESPESCKAN